MNWDAIGALGEVIGAIAVIATLLYLAVQVRQGKEAIERNEKLALSQVHQARTDTRVHFLISSASLNTPKMEAIMKDHQKIEELSDIELTSFINLQRAGIAIQDNVLFQYELGLLDEQTLVSTDDVIKRLYPVWEYLEIPISPRITNWQKNHAT